MPPVTRSQAKLRRERRDQIRQRDLILTDREKHNKYLNRLIRSDYVPYSRFFTRRTLFRVYALAHLTIDIGTGNPIGRVVEDFPCARYRLLERVGGRVARRVAIFHARRGACGVYGFETATQRRVFCVDRAVSSERHRLRMEQFAMSFHPNSSSPLNALSRHPHFESKIFTTLLRTTCEKLRDALDKHEQTFFNQCEDARRQGYL